MITTYIVKRITDEWSQIPLMDSKEHNLSNRRQMNKYCKWLNEQGCEFKVARTHQGQLLVWSNISEVMLQSIAT